MSLETFEKNSFLAGGNAAFVEDLYARYIDDTSSVDAEWQRFFESYLTKRPMS